MIVRFGFRRTALWGAVLIVLGLFGLLTAAAANAPVPWISASCAIVGAGLGPMSLAQILAIQHVVSERQRGVATSLVPFFRTIGGSLGVGALGGILSAGLSRHLGSAAESAGRMLAGRASAADAAIVSPTLLRGAIEHSLLPVFAVLLVLAFGNIFATVRFPARVRASEAVDRPVLSGTLDG
jgi:MFS family permease